MNRFDDPTLLRDELTRRFDLVLRPSTGEIERYRLEAARLAMVLADREAAEREAARGVFLMPPEAAAPVLLRTAA
ncbi:hypothetical protein [Aureimonas sp. ME7]|uniref:hypothetical protein n=1 Tax=Aureimonas sp. ME7 TaxID=2744252 RepID=UPI0015F38F95|nr:hypothetical protein [Aureimonas sp. ME7]